MREVLRLGTHQLLATRIQPHAAVATSVNLVKEAAGQRPAGFVNAVLRRVATRDLTAWLDIAAPPRDADPAGHLAVRYSHPRWIVEAFAAALGESPASGLAATEALLAADNERPAVHLCAVPGLASQQELTAAGCSPARWSQFGAYLGRVIRRPFPQSRRAGPASRTRPASSRPRRWPGWMSPGATTGGWTCARGRAARRACWPGWPPARAPGWSPPSCASTGPGWCSRPSPRPGPGPRSSPTAPCPPGARRASTGSSPTCRALAWARCAAGRKPAGGGPRPTWQRSAACSAACWPRRWTRPGPAASSPT